MLGKVELEFEELYYNMYDMSKVRFLVSFSSFIVQVRCLIQFFLHGYLSFLKSRVCDQHVYLHVKN